MYYWLGIQPTVLDELIGLDGPGGHNLDLCSSCANPQPQSHTLYRCIECSYSLLHCGGCIVAQHKALPLHRLEVCETLSPRLSSNSHCDQHWQNGFFDRTSLHSLGLICNLGHNGDACPGGSSPYDLSIIDINGLHQVRVLFCSCDANTPWDERYRQLLRMRWYPASFGRPRTAFSFDLLETYHKLTLQGKINLYDFYLGIMQKSDNQGRSKPAVCNLLYVC